MRQPERAAGGAFGGAHLDEGGDDTGARGQRSFVHGIGPDRRRGTRRFSRPARYAIERTPVEWDDGPRRLRGLLDRGPAYGSFGLCLQRDLRRRLPGYKFDATVAETSELIRPDWLSGLFFLMRSETYRGLGRLDETYHLYFEDVEFCTRARLAGLKLLVDATIHVQHDAHRASREKLVYLLWHIQSAIRFFTSPTYKKALNNE